MSSSKKGSYLENYRDPRWQKKRLEIMQRDGFKCRRCGDDGETLHVHHCYYEDGKMPWEYQQSSLVTLCEECHEGEKDRLHDNKKKLLALLSVTGFVSDDIECLWYDMVRCVSVFRTPDDFTAAFQAFTNQEIRKANAKSVLP